MYEVILKDNINIENLIYDAYSKIQEILNHAKKTYNNNAYIDILNRWCFRLIKM